MPARKVLVGCAKLILTVFSSIASASIKPTITEREWNSVARSGRSRAAMSMMLKTASSAVTVRPASLPRLCHLALERTLAIISVPSPGISHDSSSSGSTSSPSWVTSVAKFPIACHGASWLLRLMCGSKWPVTARVRWSVKMPPRVICCSPGAAVACGAAVPPVAGAGACAAGASSSSSSPQPISAAPARPRPATAEPRSTPRRESRLPAVRAQ